MCQLTDGRMLQSCLAVSASAAATYSDFSWVSLSIMVLVFLSFSVLLRNNSVNAREEIHAKADDGLVACSTVQEHDICVILEQQHQITAYCSSCVLALLSQGLASSTQFAHRMWWCGGCLICTSTMNLLVPCLWRDILYYYISLNCRFLIPFVVVQALRNYCTSTTVFQCGPN